MKNEKKKVVESYFKAFGNGDMESVLNHFHPDCFIVSVKDDLRDEGQLHGSYRGKNEASVFLSNIARLFETKSFDVDLVSETEGDVVYANGSFAHEVKATGKMFYSDWVQRCVIQDGLIKEYRFYEDSAAYHLAADESLIEVS